ncbi:hypothetical protein L9G16_23225, partial [Shewanella sp. A25]|nr:hypothetical protein [Shewanella shenzhenensis]
AGEWNVVEKLNCSNVATAMLNTTQEEAAANWTSPSSNISSVEIRAYIIYENNITEFKTATLREVPRTDPTTASTTPDPVS